MKGAVPGVAAGIAIALCACAGGGRPNVLLIVLDTARADRFSFEGYARPTTPAIAALGAEGAVYGRAYTPAPWTLPAHASLFTGLFPSAHGADSGHLHLDEGFTTLAETFQDAGYRTLAYAANPWVGRSYGLDQGFDTYEEIWKEGGGKRDDAGAEAINGKVMRYLAWRAENPGAREQPFFIFLNYLEAHLPYDPPEPERARFVRPGAAPADVERLRRFRHPDEVKYVLGLGGLDGADLPLLSDLYDGEIAYLDRRVGELVAFLRERGLLDRTVVVVTSDHGEALGEHGFLDHKLSVYDELLRVPLVVRYPRAVAAGQRIDEPVMLQDLHPTLIALAGGGAAAPGEAVPLPGFAGSRRGGTKAVAAARGAERGTALVSEFARPLPFLEIIEQRFPEARIAPWDRALVACRAGGEKLHWSSDGRHRLYDMARDPAELHDLAAERPGRVRELAAAVEAWLSRPAARPPLRLAPQ